MRKTLLVALAVIVAGVVACDSPTAVGPPAAEFELVDTEQRLDPNLINSHVHGTFALEFGNGGGVITDGPGVVPGNGKLHGWCYDGEWENPKGKPTSGSVTRPHPFCYQTSTSIQVVLEPISSRNDNVGRNNEFLQLADDRPKGDVRIHSSGSNCGGTNPPCTGGRGTIEAYAINAETFERVGIITIDLVEQYEHSTNLFLEDCSLDINETHVRCLNKVILADYEPLPEAEGGVGTSRLGVPGMLYWVNASEPFNYDHLE